MRQVRLFDFKNPSKAIDFYFATPDDSKPSIEPRWDLGGILVSWDDGKEETVEWNA